MSSEAPTKDASDASHVAAKDPAATSEGASDPNASYVGAASNAASSAATTAATTAQGVKDSVFSMFGGGAKKPERKDDEDEGEGQDRSGSAKAAKDAKAADENGDGDDKAVSSFYNWGVSWRRRSSWMEW